MGIVFSMSFEVKVCDDFKLIPEICRIINDVYADHEADLLYYDDENTRTNEIYLNDLVKNGELIVGLLDGKPIGTIKMSKSATLGYRDKPQYREIGQLALLPEHRGNGYGAMLMNFAITNVET